MVKSFAAANKYIPVSNKLLMRLIDSMPADALEAFGPFQTTECVTCILPLVNVAYPKNISSAGSMWLLEPKVACSVGAANLCTT
jgi:hypothetical protein